MLFFILDCREVGVVFVLFIGVVFDGFCVG